jgi:hypothetical protein
MSSTDEKFAYLIGKTSARHSFLFSRRLAEWQAVRVTVFFVHLF